MAVNGRVLPEYNGLKPEAEEVYRSLQINYPKFFKMDVLCKWAIIGAECLLKEGDGTTSGPQQYVYDGLDRSKIAVVLMTSTGCLDVDKKYLASMEAIASPALFVYTLPNIMLGEICIKHGFKGEQLCLVSEAPDAGELFFWVNDLLQNRRMEACLCGWVEATKDIQEVRMMWIDKKSGHSFSRENLMKCLKPTIH